jgi:hypothetical protein
VSLEAAPLPSATYSVASLVAVAHELGTMSVGVRGMTTGLNTRISSAGIMMYKPDLKQHEQSAC